MAQAYVEIPLKNSDKVALVDVEDAPMLLAAGEWTLHTAGNNDLPYARLVGVKEFRLLHRHLLGLPKGRPFVDHINGDGLDNRRENLRVATPKQNAANSRIRVNNTSGYAGVYRWAGKWRARLREAGSGACLYTGQFDTAKEAAYAYDRAVREFRGSEFGAFNFPEVGERSAITGEIRTI